MDEQLKNPKTFIISGLTIFLIGLFDILDVRASKEHLLMIIGAIVTGAGIIWFLVSSKGSKKEDS